MFELDAKSAKEILVSELDFKPHEADTYLKNYPLLDNRFQPTVGKYFSDRQILDISIEGISLAKLMETHHFHFFEALWSLNQLATRSLTKEERDALIAFFKTPMARA